jgi:hypothetical protein
VLTWQHHKIRILQDDETEYIFSQRSTSTIALKSSLRLIDLRTCKRPRKFQYAENSSSILEGGLAKASDLSKNMHALGPPEQISMQ